VILNEWHGDHAYTFAVGDPGEEVSQLIRATKESLYKALKSSGRKQGRRYFIRHTEHTEKKYGMV